VFLDPRRVADNFLQEKFDEQSIGDSRPCHDLRNALTNLLRVTFFSAAAVSLFAASMVTVSMLIPGRAPHSTQFWIITIGVGLYFAALGLVLLGIGRHLPAIGDLAHATTNDEGALLRSRWRRLAVHMLLGGLLVVPVLLLIAYAILARIDEGFALFG
jgi:cbb3-type cytochrome oxidase subunit 1